MMILRVIVTIIFATIFLLPVDLHNLSIARLRLGLMVITGAVFYYASSMIVAGVSDGAAVILGYSFVPYLLVVMVALFPLTILEGSLAIATAFVAVILTQLSLGTLTSIESLAQLWLLALLSVFVLAAEVTQLQMLLRLYRQATRDHLTGLLNRRSMSKVIDNEIERSHRYGHKLSILLFDLDRFKRVNDNHGHLVGDLVLQEFSALVVRELRQSDTVVRYGGEEFLAVLPETTLSSAQDLAERVRAAVEASSTVSTSGEVIDYTTSIGVTELIKDEEVETAIKRVDDCLYRAKEEGRNRVVAAELTTTQPQKATRSEAQ